MNRQNTSYAKLNVHPGLFLEKLSLFLFNFFIYKEIEVSVCVSMCVWRCKYVVMTQIAVRF